MLGLLDRAPQLKDATGHATGCECANAVNAKSYAKEHFLGELETVMK
ncbi:hypothetical protein ABIB85_004722 [Bradyrhizobium sp. JR1.5]